MGGTLTTGTSGRTRKSFLGRAVGAMFLTLAAIPLIFLLRKPDARPGGPPAAALE